MSSEILELEKGLCRCCHSQGSFKNLAEPIKTTGLSVFYADILNECFDIDMCPVAGILNAATYTICDVCAIRLQDASDFKKQVLLCEARFHDLLNKNRIKVVVPIVDVEVKEEVIISDSEDDGLIVEAIPEVDNDDNDFNDYNASEDLNFSDKEEDQPMEEVVSEKESKCKTKKTVTKKTKQQPAKKKKTGEKKNAEKKQGRVLAPKFRLNEEDYRQVGDTYQCAKCDKTYDKINTLKFHLKTKHYKIGKHKCSICMEEFMTPAPLTIHKLEVHNVDDRVNCQACNKVFNSKVQLRKHINNFHMLGERYKCEFCDYESFSFEGMYKHKFKHKTVKDHHCRFCRKSFVRKTTLALHERIHTGDRRKVCTECGQAFVQKASLNYHMTKYHPEVNF